MRFVVSLMALLSATPALTQTALSDKPLVETAPVIGWGDYVWLLPIVLAMIVAAAWILARRRRRL